MLPEQRRCLRCKALYDEDGDSQCRYHPGVYGGGISGLPSLGRVGWSCCSTWDEHAAGCNYGQHYPSGELGPVTNGLRQRQIGQRHTLHPKMAGAGERGVAAGSRAESSTGMYVVSVGDSIASVSMKCGVRRDLLLKVTPEPLFST